MRTSLTIFLKIAAHSPRALYLPFTCFIFFHWDSVKEAEPLRSVEHGCVIEIRPDTIRREAGEIKVCKGNREIKVLWRTSRGSRTAREDVWRSHWKALLCRSARGCRRSIEELETDQGESRERQNPLAPLCLSPLASNHDVLWTVWLLLHFQLPHLEQIPFLANFNWKLYKGWNEEKHGSSLTNWTQYKTTTVFNHLTYYLLKLHISLYLYVPVGVCTCASTYRHTQSPKPSECRDFYLFYTPQYPEDCKYSMNNCWLNFWLLALELYLGAKSESGSLIYGWQNRGSGNEWVLNSKKLSKSQSHRCNLQRLPVHKALSG